MKPFSVNSRIIAINSYLRWKGLSHLCLGNVKERQLIHPTLKEMRSSGSSNGSQRVGEASAHPQPHSFGLWIED